MILYFLPNRSTARLADMPGLGLAHAFDPAGQFETCACQANGVQGLAVMQAPIGAKVSLANAVGNATWHPLDLNPLPQSAIGNPQSAILVGLPPSPISPALLERRQRVPAHEIRLADGQLWRIPIARFISGPLAGGTPFPFKLGFRGGKWQATTLEAAHQALLEAACVFFNEVVCGLEATAAGATEAPTAPMEARVTITGQCDMVAQAMALQYRLSPAEIGILGLLDTQVVGDAALAVIDWPSLKKNSPPAASNSTPGALG